MSKKASQKKETNPTTIWLVGGLGALVVIVGLMALSNHQGSADPTLTAAPKIVSTPDHPLTIHTKSPEVYELEMKQAGVPADKRKMGTPPNLNP